jgi:hypothetical protein
MLYDNIAKGTSPDTIVKIKERKRKGENFGILPSELIIEIFLFAGEDVCDYLKTYPSFFYHFNFHLIENKDIQEKFLKNNIFVEYVKIKIDVKTMIKEYIWFCFMCSSVIDSCFLRRLCKRSRLNKTEITPLFNEAYCFCAETIYKAMCWYSSDQNIDFLKLQMEISEFNMTRRRNILLTSAIENEQVEVIKLLLPIMLKKICMCVDIYDCSDNEKKLL